MATHQDIDLMPEQESGTVLWLVPIESALIAWTQEEGEFLHVGEQVWRLCKEEPEPILHPSQE